MVIFYVSHVWVMTYNSKKEHTNYYVNLFKLIRVISTSFLSCVHMYTYVYIHRIHTYIHTYIYISYLILFYRWNKGYIVNCIVCDLVKIDSKSRISTLGNWALDLDVVPPLLAAMMCTDYVHFVWFLSFNKSD